MKLPSPNRRQQERRTSEAALDKERRRRDRRERFFPGGDRRLAERQGTAFPVTLGLHTSAGDETIWGDAVDVSPNGFRWRGVDKIPLQHPLSVVLYPPDIFVPIQAEGRAVWRQSAKEGYEVGLTLQLTAVDKYPLWAEFLQRQRLRTNKLFLHIQKGWEFLIYRCLLRWLLSLSQLGNTSLHARANTGVNFDHIYHNKPEGQGILGRWVDRALLSLPAARATRERKTLLVEALVHRFKRDFEAGQVTRVVDLGSGPSSYILEAMRRVPEAKVEAVGLDMDRDSVSAGRRIAQGYPMRFIRADVFRLDRLQRFAKLKQWSPTVVVVSGLIYYFEDAMVRSLFQSVGNLLKPGGWFLFSNMIQNPNSRLIGKLFVTDNGRAWVPFGRRKEVVGPWLDEAGFAIRSGVVETLGMYALYVAQKKGGEETTTEPADIHAECRVSGVAFRIAEHLPKGQDRLRGIFLLVHGLGYCTKSYPLTPEVFTSRGWMLCTFNLRGHAGNEGEWTLRDSVADVRGIIRWLRVKHQDSRLPVVVISHSTGSLITFMTSLDQPLINGAVFVSPVTSVYDSFRHWHQSGFNQSVKTCFRWKGIIPPIVERYLDDLAVIEGYRDGQSPVRDLQVPYRYGLLKAQSFEHLSNAIAFSPDMAQLGPRWKVPTVVFAGRKDNVMNLDAMRRAFDCFASPTKEWFDTQGEDHFLSEDWDLIQERALTLGESVIAPSGYS